MKMFDLNIFRTTAQDLKAKAGALRGQLEKARRRREDLMTMPRPKNEVADILGQLVDREADKYPEELRKSAHRLVTEPLRGIEGQELYRVYSPLRAPNAGQSGVHDVSIVALCFLFRDQIKSGLRDAVEKMEYPTDTGPALADRAAEIQKLNKEIAQLESQEREMFEAIEKARREFD